MRLALDIQPLESESAERGVGRYSAGLAEAIIASGRIETVLVLNTALDKRHDKALAWARRQLPDDQIKVFAGPVGLMGLHAGGQNNWQLASALYDAFLRRHNISHLHTAAPFDGMGDETVMSNARSSFGNPPFRVATLYDLIPFQDPDLYLADPRYDAWYRHRLDSLRGYDLLWAISDYTRDVAISSFGFRPDQVVSISTDTTEAFRPVSLTADETNRIQARYGISQPFLMHTGILESRKNVKTLVTAFAALPRDVQQSHQLVLVAQATDAQKAETLRHATQLGLYPQSLVFAGFVPDDDLACLYSLTKGLVMPSTSEGFGLPLLEAMRCGAPALGANASSIPEVVGDPEYLFNPHDPAELTGKLHRLLTDADYAARARDHARQQQGKFSWQKSADAALDALLAKAPAAPAHRPRAAIRYYPVPQTRSDYSVRIAGLVDGDTLLAGRETAGNSHAVPVVIAAAGELSPRQEQMIAGGPFLLLTHAMDARVTVSPVTKYLCEGYAPLLGMTPATVRDIAGLGNCLFSAEINDSNEFPACAAAMTAAGQDGLDGIFAFLDHAPGGQAHDPAARFAAAALQNLLNPAKVSGVLYVDISELVQQDAKTGIQRVVRSLLHHLLAQKKAVRVEPVYRDGDHYRLARAFCCRFLSVPDLGLPDVYVNFRPGDTFLGLDLDALVTPVAMNRLRRERLRGVKLAWVVYDILPMTHPEWFDPPLAAAVQKWLKTICAEADQLICISRAVADDLHGFVQAFSPQRSHPLTISWWHLGADLDGSTPTKGRTASEQTRVDSLPADVPIFITVGTIEPRKGIAKLLDGIDAFFAAGGQAGFVLVGKTGWNVDTLVHRIKTHPEAGRRLFWFEGASDETLDTLYKRATAVLLPSEGEGFGLPLVEAAFHGKPIVARDLPVFREIGGDGAFYFTADTGEIFAGALRDWLDLWSAGQHPLPATRQLTWRESSDQFFEILMQTKIHQIWHP